MAGPAWRTVVERLEQAGYEAYLVGGAVRDHLLGRPVEEYDVATSAPPDVQRAALSEWPLEAVGQAFGVLAVSLAGTRVDVATFRSEAYGADPHRPERVTFIGNLEADLARRDFAINAMAMRPDGTIIDPFGGRADLAAGVIRAIGDPLDRLREDPLRAHRAARLAAVLDFDIDPALQDAMGRIARRAAGLAVERVRDEWRKMLLADRPDRGLHALAESGLLFGRARAGDGRPGSLHRGSVRVQLLPRSAWGTAELVRRTPLRETARWAVLLSRLTPRAAAATCRRLRLANRLTDAVALCLAVQPPDQTDPRAVVDFLLGFARRTGSRPELEARLADWTAVWTTLGRLPGARALVIEAESRRRPLFVSELSVRGADILATRPGLAPGPWVGRRLRQILLRDAHAEPGRALCAPNPETRIEAFQAHDRR